MKGGFFETLSALECLVTVLFSSVQFCSWCDLYLGYTFIIAGIVCVRTTVRMGWWMDRLLRHPRNDRNNDRNDW